MTHGKGKNTNCEKFQSINREVCSQTSKPKTLTLLYPKSGGIH